MSVLDSSVIAKKGQSDSMQTPARSKRKEQFRVGHPDAALNPAIEEHDVGRFVRGLRALASTPFARWQPTAIHF